MRVEIGSYDGCKEMSRENETACSDVILSFVYNSLQVNWDEIKNAQKVLIPGPRVYTPTRENAVY